MKKTLGIDLGGTKIRTAIMNEAGEMLAETYEPAHADQGHEAVLAQMEKTIRTLGTEGIEACGLGTPGFIDTKNGIVTFAGNIKGWTGLNLKKAMEDRIPELKFYIENDANIAAVAEKWLGAAKDFPSFIMLTLGTGVGGAIYNDKMGLWEGEHFQGAELGHMILHPGGEPCTCGQKGCIESYCSGTGIVSDYQRRTGQVLTGAEIFDRAEAGEAAANETRKVFQENLATVFTTMRNAFDPSAIVVGGGVINSKDYWWDGAIEAYRDICNRPDPMLIVPAEFLNDAGVIGACKIAFDRHYKEG